LCQVWIALLNFMLLQHTCLRMHVHTSTASHTCLCMHVHTSTPSHTYLRMHVHTSTPSHTCGHARTHAAHVHTNTHACERAHGVAPCALHTFSGRGPGPQHHACALPCWPARLGQPAAGGRVHVHHGLRLKGGGRGGGKEGRSQGLLCMLGKDKQHCGAWPI